MRSPKLCAGPVVLRRPKTYLMCLSLPLSLFLSLSLSSHPCVRSHGETLRHRNELKDLWHTLARPTKTDDPKDASVPLFAAGLKGFFAPTGPSGKTAEKQRHDFNPTNAGVFAPVSQFLTKASRGSSVVLWLRRNPLDRFLSFAREKQTGAPHCQAKVKPRDAPERSAPT